MWAGGKIKWNKEPLIVGEKATATCRIGSVVKKGFDKGSPMVFVHTKMDIQMEGRSEASVQEERTHVYLPESANKRVIREGERVACAN
jgi:hydroxyacyl-ACP dehydratase HTD2-like protein with hotdog domain